MAVGDRTHRESDGKSVTVNLLFTVRSGQIAFVNNWLGIASRSGDSGQAVALNIERAEFQFQVPAALTVNVGDTVWVNPANRTGHTLNDNAYATSAGAGRVRLFKATSAKDSFNVVTGILLGGISYE